MALGLTTAIATSALSRETPTKETPETTETHVEKRIKRLWVRTGETMKRLRSTSAGRWWLAWVSGGQKWVLESSKAVNVVCLAVFDPSTNSALSQLLGVFKKKPFGVMLWVGAHDLLQLCVTHPVIYRYCVVPRLGQNASTQCEQRSQVSKLTEICVLRLSNL